MKKYIDSVGNVEIYYSKKGFCTNLNPKTNFKFLMDLLINNQISSISDKLATYL